MSLLSDLPDDILNLISIRLNGFDNCSLWMASDSIIRERLVKNVITDFDIKYTIPGRYLWPGNFLKKLQRLSRLSLVVHEDVHHLPIEDVEIHPMSTLQYLRLEFTNWSHVFDQNHLVSSDISTGPTASDNELVNLNNYYFSSLEHLEIITPSFEKLSIDFLRCLPQKLNTLLIPQHHFELECDNPSENLHAHIEILPRTLTKLDIYFYSPPSNMAYLDLSKLPPNLTSLAINVSLNDQTYQHIPKSLKKLILHNGKNNMEKLLPYLPIGLETLVIPTDKNPLQSQMFSRFQNLEKLYLMQPKNKIELDDFIINCPPKLKKFICDDLVLTNLPVPSRLFSNCLTKLYLSYPIGISSEFISSLPQSLTHLVLNKPLRGQEPFAFFSLLPRKLTLLKTNFLVVEKISLLPESLTTLSLMGSFESSHFDRLPPKVETFTIQQSLPKPMTTHLPESLTSLQVFGYDIFDHEIIAMLPRGLKHLFMECPDNITDADIAHLPPSLERLLLVCNTQLTDDAIPLLPRGLVELNLDNNSNFTDECIKHLPRNLTSLHMNNAKLLTPDSCKYLPRYLKELHLLECNWDPEIFVRQLPRFLQSIRLENMESNV